MSKEVKRYDPFGYDGLSALMHEDVLGDYVRHEDYETLLAERDALKKDAERYRWLRDKAVDAEGVYPMVSLTDDTGDQVSNWLFGKAVDSAIDAALQGEQP